LGTSVFVGIPAWREKKNKKRWYRSTRRLRELKRVALAEVADGPCA
jgi:hypothetical protein